MAAAETKPSLVDIAEHALRTWLAAGRHRAGERLPPEQELSGQLGISRGTLRTALRRLEESGEIVRRQGSGTYVGRPPRPTLDEGLEKLVSYSELARRRGVRLEVQEMEVAEEPLGADLGALFGLDADTPATTVTRVLLIDGQPGAVMRDVVRPGMPLPSPARLRRALERGDMVIDVLMREKVPLAFARTHVAARLVTPRDELGQALGVGETTAALELQHETCTAEGSPVEHSTDVFLSGSLDVHVLRWLEDQPPVPAIGRGAVVGGAS